MMGGKQKLAAKIKKWKQAKSLQLQVEAHAQQTSESDQSSEDKSSGSGSRERYYENNGSGDHWTAQDLHRLKLEVRRQRRRKRRIIGNNLLARWADRSQKYFENCPKWIILIALSTFGTIIGLFMLRTIIKLVAPVHFDQIDRTPLYSSFQKLPKPVYKSLLILDYFFTSSTLSWSGFWNIVTEPSDISTGSWRHRGIHHF